MKESTILVVDDDPIARESIKALLENDGYVLEFASSGKDGIVAAKAIVPDLVLLDVMMPGMDGYETCRNLRSDERLALVPIILVTALDDRDSRLRGISAGADDFVAKPFDRVELLARVRTVTRLNRFHRVLGERENFQRLAELSPGGLLVCRPDGGVLFASRRLKHIVECATGSLRSDADTLHQLTRRVLDLLGPDPIHAGDREPLLPDVSWMRSDGRTIPLEVGIGTLEWEGQPALQLLVTDISGRKAVERELVMARNAAEKLSSIRGVLLTALSHEFRTPLNGILGLGSLLQEEDLTDDQGEMVSGIVTSANRLNQTLTSVTDYAQLSEGEVRAASGVCDLHEVLRAARDRWSGRAAEVDLELCVRDDAHGQKIMADAAMLDRVIDKLLDNAFKFTARGTVTVCCSANAALGGIFATIVISDTGIGIPQEIQEKVFEPFRQGSEGPSRTHEGLGLGLSIARRLVELMHGTITISSQAGAGTEVRVTLPRVHTPQTREIPDVVPAAINPAPHQQKASILLVEDNFINAEVLKREIAKLYTVDHVATGEAAVQLASQKQYDLVLMDIHLGAGIDGVEACWKIRSLPAYQTIPIVAMTGYALIGDRDRFIESGMTDYLSKPVEPGDLFALLAKYLRGQHAEHLDRIRSSQG